MIISKVYMHMKAEIQKFYLFCFYSKSISFGGGVTWRKHFVISTCGTGNIKIGSNVFFNHNCSVISRGTIEIGDGCLFGENVKIYDHNHRFNNINASIKSQGYSVGEIHIGNHCWIGSNVIILKGANIGENCVIGAGTIISRNIPNNTIVQVNQDAYIHQELIEKEFRE